MVDDDASQGELSGLDYIDIFERNVGIFTREEQRRLRKSTVLVAGTGGVGGPSSVTLARMGIGKLLLADFDSYVPSNLNRQIPSTIDDLGKNKAEVLKAHIQKIDPFAEVEAISEGITGNNIDILVSESDVVVSSIDTFMTIALQRALRRNSKMGFLSSPLFDRVILTCFPPEGYYLSDVYPFDIDEAHHQLCNDQYYAFIAVVTGGRELRPSGYFSVISPGTFIAGGLIGYQVAHYLIGRSVPLPAFPTRIALDTRTLRSRPQLRYLIPVFAALKYVPPFKKIVMRGIQKRAMRMLELRAE